MNEIKHQVEQWMAEGKPQWQESLKTIRELNISDKDNWGDLFRALRQQVLYGAEFEQMLLQDDSFRSFSLSELQDKNQAFYADILPGEQNYDVCFGNPDYSTSKFGLEIGQLVSAIYSELHTFRYNIRIGNYTGAATASSLFLALYELWQQGRLDFESGLAAHKEFFLRNMEMNVLMRFYMNNDPQYSLYRDLLLSSDFSDVRYLYRFGIYVEPKILQMAKFISAYPETELRSIARYLVDAYLVSFERKNQDYRKKKYARVAYPMGMERLAVMVMEELNKSGLEPTIGYPNIRGANEQYTYDQRFDEALYYNQEFADRSYAVVSEAILKLAPLFKLQSGGVVVILFGEEPFIPVPKKTALRLSEEQDKIQHLNSSRIQKLYFDNFPREETSFSVIAFPSTEIGDKFEAVFKDTLELNYLDSMHYATLQEKIIEVLDQAQYVQVKGVPGNDTDIRVQLHQLSDPTTETNFENCVADVNIPVGEVFTSPLLTGTDGILHVEDTFLQGLRFLNLRLHFKDGLIVDYSCTNFEDAEENRKYIFENLLQPHKTLPIGEFAIGTNTKAYRMAKRYDIQYLLPVLIIEKMGPHFAIGDTCYSFEEDYPHYGILSKKKIIAVENEKSCQRKTDPAAAYTQKHCDITLPYDMLEEIAAVRPDGTRIPIILKGRFVVPGTEELNTPLDQP